MIDEKSPDAILDLISQRLRIGAIFTFPNWSLGMRGFV